MQRAWCGACVGTDLEVFLNLGETPIANRYPKTRNEKEEWYPLRLGRCGNCGLVQIMDIVPDHELYDVDYGFYSGGSQAQRDYHEAGFRLLHKRFSEQAQRLTIEIACNDGSLLKHFKNTGYPTLGVDPAFGPVKIARQEHGLNVVQERLTTELAQRMRDEHGPAGLIIAYNSMAHVEHLSDVLTGVRTLMDNDSIAVFEVQYLPDLLTGNMYDQVYHEHRFFYSLRSISHALRLHGLYVIDAELIELQCGGLRVTITADPRKIPSQSVSTILASESWLTSHAFDSVQGRVNRTRDHLLSIVANEIDAKRTLAGYAAAAKATTILNFCGIGNDVIPYIVDSTPYKQGKYLPGTRIPIVSPEHAKENPVHTFLLLSANYLAAVLRNSGHTGRWITPLPLPMIV